MDPIAVRQRRHAGERSRRLGLAEKRHLEMSPQHVGSVQISQSGPSRRRRDRQDQPGHCEGPCDSRRRRGGTVMNIQKTDTAVVFIDPQNDVLSEKGANWGAVGASVTENRTVENMERIFEAAKRSGYEVFISPHYFYPTDDGWKMNGPLEADEFRTHTFARKGPLTLTGFANSGADWLDRFKRYIEDGKTIVVSPHKVFGPQTNDLVLQLRKRGMSKIILGGMLANMCVESHLRDATR